MAIKTVETRDHAEVRELIQEWTKAVRNKVNSGIMRAGDGLHARAKGRRVRRSGTSIVTDGPFTETKEFVAGC
jgi:hypothetical protein